ncbi:helix-turn-helix domain-containing protein [Pedobacter aquatilis]|uniref:helix-turn-helix domain-containing protein n=1 Tax=Pedobacter aquatilis TaxID=351343 RepID=UPI00292E346C|nr:helix-turn-helix domain-containing protein [Pedobacter aquatilis]
MFKEFLARLDQILELLFKILAELKQREPEQEEVWLDSAALKQRLNISDRTVYRMRKNGLVVARQLSGKWYYKLPELDIVG